MTPVARVVVGLPVPRVFSYAVPPELGARLAPGQRVRVPFRGKSRPGVVVELGGDRTEGLERIDAALDPVPALTPALLALARWAAHETASAWGEAVIRSLPPSARAGAPATLPAPRAVGPAGDEGLVVAWGAGRTALVEALVHRTLGAGRAVLLLAPEIGVAGEWADRLGRSLGEPVALLTSAATPRRRWQAWWQARAGSVRVAVGTRVAAFLPLEALGLGIVVDEDDPAHKAPDAPRWHARELLVKRAALEGASCVLASPAPSLESWARVVTGEARREEAPGPPGRAWPRVVRVDLRPADPARALSGGLREAAREALAAGRAVVLLLNRLGYGRVLACADCGAVRRCPRCRLALTFHQAQRALACRLCGGQIPARSLCPRCRGRRLLPAGWGTERVEAEARAAFPGSRVERYDSTVPTEAAAGTRAAFRSGAVHVLVGTQMALRLLGEAPVGVAALVLADTTLNLPDFRAAERTFQTAWRLAEGVAPGGSLWLQSFYPEHPALLAVEAGAREPFYEREWAERRELGYPPARRMARLLLAGRAALRQAGDLAARGQAAGLTVLGPATLPGDRVQVVLLGGAELPGAVGGLVGALRGRRPQGARLSVDVDPVELP